MILVFGGTTEGKNTASVLERLRLPYLYSTKSEVSFQANTYGSYRFGALNNTDLQHLIQEKGISTIINAAHPFAHQLHTTISEVCALENKVCIRYGRKASHIPAHPFVHWVGSYEEAMAQFSRKHVNQRLLALTGVQSITKLQTWWHQHTAYFRILDRSESKSIAQQAGFPASQLILDYPAKNIDEEIALIQSKKIDFLLTKDSGASSFLETKVQAAIVTDCPIYILERPEIPKHTYAVESEEALLQLLTSKLDQL